METQQPKQAHLFKAYRIAMKYLPPEKKAEMKKNITRCLKNGKNQIQKQ